MSDFTERIVHGLGPFRWLDGSPVERRALMACAAWAHLYDEEPPLGELAVHLGLPESALEQALLLHEVLDHPDDAWFTLDPQRHQAGTRSHDNGFPYATFLKACYDRWPGETVTVVGDLILDTCEERFFDLGWYILLLLAPDSPLPGPLSRYLLDRDLGSLPERIFTCSPEWFVGCAPLLVSLFHGGLDISERLAERLLAGDLLDLVARVASAHPTTFEDGGAFVFQVVNGLPDSPRLFLERMVTYGYADLPDMLQLCLLARDDGGLRAVQEAIRTADRRAGGAFDSLVSRWRREGGVAE